mmetsp:Transcript_117024/g.342753  ORF Transcript_117024/g.342753 Transcript_117024/m.342753 type:complete len:204 (+) Transcript_117024:676-1287(+)
MTRASHVKGQRIVWNSTRRLTRQLMALSRISAAWASSPQAARSIRRTVLGAVHSSSSGKPWRRRWQSSSSRSPPLLRSSQRSRVLPATLCTASSSTGSAAAQGDSGTASRCWAHCTASALPPPRACQVGFRRDTTSKDPVLLTDTWSWGASSPSTQSKNVRKSSGSFTLCQELRLSSISLPSLSRLTQQAAEAPIRLQGAAGV